MREWKVGQEVFLGERLCVVERVTPKGFPVVEGRMWDRDGGERGASTWRRDFIRPATQELRDEIAERKAVREQHTRFDRLTQRMAAVLPGWGRGARISSSALSRICDVMERELTEAEAS